MTDDYSADRLLNPAYNIPGIDVWSQPRIAPSVDPDTAPWLCVRFNREWLQYILPALDVLRWEDYYHGTPTEQAIQAQRGMQLITLFLLADLCGDEDMDFRQNPSNPCLLEYSKNDGATWLPMFDYSLCFDARGPSLADINIIVDLINQVTIDIAILNNIYDGTPESIAPDMDYDGGAGDENRDETLCAALHLTMRIVAQAGIERAEEKESFVEDVIGLVRDLLIGIGGILLILAGFPAASAAFRKIAVALFAGGLTLVIKDFIIQADKAAFEDEVALREVSCCVFEALKGADVTETAFNNALSTPCAWESEHSPRVAELWHLLAQERDFYLSFLDALQETYAVQQAGAELPCDCETWEHTFDFTADDGGFELSIPGRGQYVAASGWEAILDTSTHKLSIRLFVAETIVDFFEITYTMSSSDSERLVQRALRLDTGVVFNSVTQPAPAGSGLTAGGDIAPIACDEFNIVGDTATAGASVLIVTSATLRGRGTNPITG